jgi:3-methyladenine DNA glycosylase AlkD
VPSELVAIDEALRTAGTPERAAADVRYLRSDLEHWGVAVPDARRICRSVDVRDREHLLAFVDGLWQGGVHDRRLLAILLLARHERMLRPGDVAQLEQLLRECRTWALLDELAIKVAGPLLDRHQDADAILARWAADDDVWIRRSALLAHLLALRSGGGDWERFTALADPLLDDRDVWVRKAIGWVVRDTGRKRPELVAAWAVPRARRMSGVTRREVAKVVPGLR